jgi:hypothetical protein
LFLYQNDCLLPSAAALRPERMIKNMQIINKNGTATQNVFQLKRARWKTMRRPIIITKIEAGTARIPSTILRIKISFFIYSVFNCETSCLFLCSI